MRIVKFQVRKGGKWIDAKMEEPPAVTTHEGVEHVKIQRSDKGFWIWTEWGRVDCRPELRVRKGGRRGRAKKADMDKRGCPRSPK